MSNKLLLLVATRKGAWIYSGDATRKSWQVDGPHFLGQIIHHLVLDPRDGKTMLAAASTGHLGPTMFRSTDYGRSWTEAKRPPAFEKSADGKGRSVKHTFWLTPGHASQKDVWYAGTSPQALFRTEDGGDTWGPVPGVNNDPAIVALWGDEQGGTPNGPTMHSIIIDPRDPKRLYLSAWGLAAPGGDTGGGVFISDDSGKTWRQTLREAQHVYDVTVDFRKPDLMYACGFDQGVFRSEDRGETWKRIGGFNFKWGHRVVPDPADPNSIYVTTFGGGVWRGPAAGDPASREDVIR